MITPCVYIVQPHEPLHSNAMPRNVLCTSARVITSNSGSIATVNPWLMTGSIRATKRLHLGISKISQSYATFEDLYGFGTHGLCLIGRMRFVMRSLSPNDHSRTIILAPSSIGFLFDWNLLLRYAM